MYTLTNRWRCYTSYRVLTRNVASGEQQTVTVTRTCASRPATLPRPLTLSRAGGGAELKVCQTNTLAFGSAELRRVSSLIRAQPGRKTKRRVSSSLSESGEAGRDEGLFEAKVSFQVRAHLHFPPSLLDLDHWR